MGQTPLKVVCPFFISGGHGIIGVTKDIEHVKLINPRIEGDKGMSTTSY